MDLRLWALYFFDPIVLIMHNQVQDKHAKHIFFF
jgi:hypothetical protein